MSYLFLVVSDNDDVDVTRMDGKALDGIVFVVCTGEGYTRTKHTLRRFCDEHFLTFVVSYVIPPVKTPPSVELLIGYGKLYDPEVMLYGCSEANRCGSGDKTEDIK